MGWLARSHARERERERGREREKIGSELGWQAIPGLGLGLGQNLGCEAAGQRRRSARACLVCWIAGGRATGRCESLLRDATLECTPAQDFAFSGRGFGAGFVICVYCTYCIPGGRRRESRLLVRVLEPRIYNWARFAFGPRGSLFFFAISPRDDCPCRHCPPQRILPAAQ